MISKALLHRCAALFGGLTIADPLWSGVMATRKRIGWFVDQPETYGYVVVWSEGEFSVVFLKGKFSDTHWLPYVACKEMDVLGNFNSALEAIAFLEQLKEEA